MNDDQQLLKETQYPTSKYDYDGITGTWLLIPAKFHILMLAIALPVILWMFPFIHLKGNYRYIFADYRYYIAGAVTLFCLASALLSILKAKQVKHRIRPISDVSRQGVTKSSGTREKVLKSISKKPKVNLGHIQKKPTPDTKIAEKKKISEPQKTVKPATKVVTEDSKAAPKTSSNHAAKPISTRSKKRQTQSQALHQQTEIKLRDSSTSQKSPQKTAASKRKKNPKQMQLDL